MRRTIQINDGPAITITATGPNAATFLERFTVGVTQTPTRTYATAAPIPNVPQLGTAEIAAIFGISQQLVAHWLKRGFLPLPALSPSGRHDQAELIKAPTKSACRVAPPLAIPSNTVTISPRRMSVTSFAFKPSGMYFLTIQASASHERFSCLPCRSTNSLHSQPSVRASSSTAVGSKPAIVSTLWRSDFATLRACRSVKPSSSPGRSLSVGSGDTSSTMRRRCGPSCHLNTNERDVADTRSTKPG